MTTGADSRRKCWHLHCTFDEFKALVVHPILPTRSRLDFGLSIFSPSPLCYKRHSFKLRAFYLRLLSFCLDLLFIGFAVWLILLDIIILLPLVR